MKYLALLLAALLAPPVAVQETLWDRFRTPPDDARPMVRWWWFGPAVDHGELDREIAAMKAGGFGGFEVQPTYPLALDDPAGGTRNLPYLSDPFLAVLRHTGDTARTAGLRMDVTIGSGWPFGGAHVPVSQAAAAELRIVRGAIAAGAERIGLPSLRKGERLVAAFVDGRRIGIDATGSVPVVASPAGRSAMLFVAGRTGQQVKRAAVGAEGFVIDHVSAAAVTHHLTAVGDRLLSAFAGTAPPYAMFADSLEAYGSSWTDDLPAEFPRRRGYDLRAEWWDPLTTARSAAGTGDIAIELAPYQSRLLVMAPGLPETMGEQPLRPLLDLSTGWQARVPGTALRAPAPGTSWTDSPALRHYSGPVRYTRAFVLPARASTGPVMLDFGDGTPLPKGDADRPRAAIAA